MFYSFILSQFKFCSVLWHNCSVSDMKEIENIQKRALRIIVNDSNATYRELRERSQRPLLYVERLRSIALTVFKIYYGIAPSYYSCVFGKRNYRVLVRVSVCVCVSVFVCVCVCFCTITQKEIDLGTRNRNTL